MFGVGVPSLSLNHWWKLSLIEHHSHVLSSSSLSHKSSACASCSWCMCVYVVCMCVVYRSVTCGGTALLGPLFTTAHNWEPWTGEDEGWQPWVCCCRHHYMQAMALCCCWKFSMCLESSLWMCSGSTPTLENSDLNKVAISLLSPILCTTTIGLDLIHKIFFQNCYVRQLTLFNWF